MARCGRRSQLGAATSFGLAQSAEHFLLAVPVRFAGDLAPPSGDLRQSISLGRFFQGLPNGPHSNLHADRRTAQLRFRMAELAKAVDHSTRSLTTYLDELHRTGVGAVYRASNQHDTTAPGAESSSILKFELR